MGMGIKVKILPTAEAEGCRTFSTVETQTGPNKWRMCECGTHMGWADERCSSCGQKVKLVDGQE